MYNIILTLSAKFLSICFWHVIHNLSRCVSSLLGTRSRKLPCQMNYKKRSFHFPFIIVLSFLLPKIIVLIQGLFSYFLSLVYCSFQVDILCNDCHATGKAPFHIFGLKCSDCNSYNTRRTGSAPQEEENPTDLSSSDHWNWFVGVSCERNQMQIIQGFCYHLHLLLQFRYFHATCMMIFSVCSAITPIAWQHCHFF